MPAAIRIIDNSKGHCFTARSPDTGSPDVFANSEQAIRAIPTSETSSSADHYPTHCCGDPCHDGVASKGSPNVFVNGQAFHRNGDAISCGDTAANGSPNVFVNSGYGAGSLIDNNPFIVSVADNDLYVPPEGVSPSPLPDATMTDVYVYENNDIPEEVNASPPNAEVQPMEEVTDDQTPPPTETPPVQDCSTVDALPADFTWSDESGSFSEFAYGFVLSNNFTVADVCFCAVSSYSFSSAVTQSSGLTQKQILLNMCHHAKTVLEPMLAAYGSFTITSGFRNKNTSSQHNKGQATDIQFLNIHGSSTTGDQYFALAQDIRDNINYDQMILEWFGRNPWIHISSNPSGHRHIVLTQVSSNSYTSGLKLLRVS